jgi:hypothetical protein
MYSLNALLRRGLAAVSLAIGGLLSLASAPATRAEPVISEFMASNSATLADDDGAFSDWIEIYNPDATAVNLNGWFLTDNTKERKKWPFPAVSLPAKGYLVVFASTKNRRDPARTLHTNFALDAGGEYLALVRPDGETATTEYSPGFPAQRSDVSYGSATTTADNSGPVAFLQLPSPRARNSGARGSALSEAVNFSRAAGPFATPFALELSGAVGNQVIRYLLIAPSSLGAASLEPTSTSPQYTGPLNITTSVVVKAAVFSANGASQGTAASRHFVKANNTGAPGILSFTSILPVVLLDNHGFGPLSKDNKDHEGWIYRYPAQSRGAASLAATPDLATPVAMTVRGSSSAGFPKKSYGIELHHPTGGHSSLPLLGSTADDDWSLIAPWFFDPTSIKNSFIYTLSNRLGRWAPATQPVELFLNTDAETNVADYAGIYVLTEKIEIDPLRVNISPLGSGSAADITGGYLLKLDSPDADEFGFSTTRDVPGSVSQIIVANAKAADLSTAQRDYIQTYIQTMEDTLATDRDGGFATRNYLDFIDRASWVDHHLLNVFASNFDAFERSAYFSKDRGGKLVAGPVWDFDRSFGAATFNATTPWDRWFVEGGVNFFQTGWWGMITRDPEFMQDWVERWQSLRQGLFSENNLLALVDSLTATIGPEAIARDAARWPLDIPEYAAGRTGGVAQMKTWMTNRIRWIDEQFVAAPSIATAGANLTFTPPSGAQLAYTLDGSDPRSLGGRLAPNAVLTSAPLTVPATRNVHVRSYRADREGVFPGSPWSSAIGGAASTPLTPASRIANISARALVGTGEDALFAGVVTRDTAAKSYLVRGIGPTLGSFGAANTLGDPELTIRRADGVEIYRNIGWQNGNDPAVLAPRPLRRRLCPRRWQPRRRPRAPTRSRALHRQNREPDQPNRCRPRRALRNQLRRPHHQPLRARQRPNRRRRPLRRLRDPRRLAQTPPHPRHRPHPPRPRRQQRPRRSHSHALLRPNRPRHQRPLVRRRRRERAHLRQRHRRRVPPRCRQRRCRAAHHPRARRLHRGSKRKKFRHRRRTPRNLRRAVILTFEERCHP